jgi:hypothetical protein
LSFLPPSDHEPTELGLKAFTDLLADRIFLGVGHRDYFSNPRAGERMMRWLEVE